MVGVTGDQGVDRILRNNDLLGMPVKPTRVYNLKRHYTEFNPKTDPSAVFEDMDTTALEANQAIVYKDAFAMWAAHRGGKKTTTEEDNSSSEANIMYKEVSEPWSIDESTANEEWNPAEDFQGAYEDVDGNDF